MMRDLVLSSDGEPPSLNECVAQIWRSRQITHEQSSLLQSWLLNPDLSFTSSDDYRVVDRLLHAVRRGWVARH